MSSKRRPHPTLLRAALLAATAISGPAAAQSVGEPPVLIQPDAGTATPGAPTAEPVQGPVGATARPGAGATPTASGAAPRQIAPWLSRALSGDPAASQTVAPVAPPEAIIPSAIPAGQTAGLPSTAAGAPPDQGDPTAAADPSPSAAGPLASGQPGQQGQPGGPLRADPPPANAPASVEVAPLDKVRPSSAGLVTAREAGLPVDSWRGSSAAEAVDLIDGLKPTELHAANRLAVRLLAAGLKPPVDDGRSVDLFSARLRALSRYGASEAAARLAEAAGPARVAAEADLALISGRDAALCKARLAEPGASGAAALERIYCLASDRQAAAARIAIQATRDLGGEEAKDEMALGLLEAMTDELLVEFVKAPSSVAELTPLRLAAMRRVKLSPPNDFGATAPLPLAAAALAPGLPPRTRIEALERLERAGAIDTKALADAYRGTPSAESGGVWGRVEAFRRAIGVGAATDGAVYAQAALAAMSRAEEAGRGAMMARLLGRETARRAASQGRRAVGGLPRDPALRRLLRLSGEAPAASLLLAAAGPETVGPEERALDRLAAPNSPGVWNPGDAKALLARAVRSDGEAGRLMAALNAFGFSTPAPTLYPEPANLPRDIAAGRIAPLAFGALRKLSAGAETPPEALYAALVTLIELGFEREARQIAVEAVLVGR